MIDTAAGLQWRYVQLGEADLWRTPILLSGSQELMLIDGGFTLSSGKLLVDEIKATKKTLSSIFVTCDDPDYYFGLGPVKAAFPHAKIIATPGTTARIRDTVAHKIEVWKEKLGSECPQGVEDIAMPTAYSGSSLMLDGVSIQVRTAPQPNRYYLWVDSLKAILGGVQIVSGIHVWMADTPREQERALWSRSLEEMLKCHPRDALPGHMTPGSPVGVDAIRFTLDYIDAFNREFVKAKDGAELILAMKKRYPDLALEFVLDLGAKVCKGEAIWP